MSDTAQQPGQGCGCRLCKQPVPEPMAQSPEQAAILQSRYEQRRRDWVAANGVLSHKGRG